MANDYDQMWVERRDSGDMPMACLMARVSSSRRLTRRTETWAWVPMFVMDDSTYSVRMRVVRRC